MTADRQPFLLTARSSKVVLLVLALLWSLPSLHALTSPSKTRAEGSDQSAPGRFCSADSQAFENAMGLERYGYESASGRPQWLNQDPIGELGGINLYQFVYSDPSNAYDPYGLCWYNPLKWNWDRIGSAFELKGGLSLGLQLKGRLGKIKAHAGADYGLGGWTNLGGDQYGEFGHYVEGNADLIRFEFGKHEAGLGVQYELKITEPRGGRGRPSISEQIDKVVGYDYDAVGSGSDSWTKIGAEGTVFFMKGGASVELKSVWDGIRDCK